MQLAFNLPRGRNYNINYRESNISVVIQPLLLIVYVVPGITIELFNIDYNTRWP